MVNRAGADLLTVWPTQETRTWSERLVVPLMAFAVHAYLPEVLVRATPWAAFAAANGQALIFRRSAYERAGGHAAVRGEVVEDVALARGAKRSGLKVVMAEGNRLVSARMYRHWAEVRDGFAKNILAGHGGRPMLLILSAIFHWALFVLPWVWLALSWATGRGPAWQVEPMAMIALGLGVRALTAASSHQKIQDALTMPLSAIIMTIIAARALTWHFWEGGPEWKGRRFPGQVSG
jgi:chlorobactene glucosyltransferase